MNLHRITAYAVAGLLTLPGAAFAQGVTGDAYDDGGNVVETVADPPAEPTPTVASEAEAAPAAAPKELARTGSDEVIIGLAGLMLLGSGFAMRRFAR